MTRLETERLVLRPLRVEDAAGFAALFADDWEAIRHTGRMPYPPTEAAMRSWIRGHLDAGQGFAILRKPEGTMIGAAGFGGTGETAELGYALGRAFWGLGLATEAVQALVAFARSRGLSALEAHSFPDNPASARVLEKAGFEELGPTLRDYPKRGGMREVRRFRIELASEG